MVDDGDHICQSVGLVEILGGQQDGGSVGDQPLDHLPQAQPAARVQAGGGLVEEQHRWPGHQRRR